MTFLFSHLQISFIYPAKIFKLPCKLVNLTNVPLRRLCGPIMARTIACQADHLRAKNGPSQMRKPGANNV